ncbi:MAG: arsenical pump-driving ATPase [Candidatus Binatia bacterium]
MDFLQATERHLFFTGKGGVGKTSTACATAIALADRGRRVLLVSTDPASNLDEVLGLALSPQPTAIPAVPGLFALNLDPEAAAREYRERVVGPYRGVLPQAAIASIEEQLSGACTVEIAAFAEFSKLLGDPTTTAGFDHVVFDTAPTGHTLRLLALPAAWSGFLDSNVGGTSCLGPLAGLNAQRDLYRAALAALADPMATILILVSRPERAALEEAERTRAELAALGIANQRLILNGMFAARNGCDPVARALEARGRQALEEMPRGLKALPYSEVPLVSFELVGIEALRGLGRDTSPAVSSGTMEPAPTAASDGLLSLDALVTDIARAGRGVIMAMGKGGVGKTTLAVAIATELARRGHRVHLTTTDPAAHVEATVEDRLPGLRASRINPEAETRAYSDEVLRTVADSLDAKGRALLEEDLRSPCTEEIAVFRAFAHIVAGGADGFVVIDTAPTGHTLLLLDAAQAYHREVARSLNDIPTAVRDLLPRLRDPEFTRVLLVTLPEATPVHEAAQLQRDLARAGITPFAWVVNQSLTPLTVHDPVLASRRRRERRYLAEVQRLATQVVLTPWGESPVQSLMARAAA